ncbi:MAG: hypothetical protein ACYCXA_04950 [Actinomycetes bacterium]
MAEHSVSDGRSGAAAATPTSVQDVPVHAVVDEQAFYARAQANASWAASRMFVAIGATVYGALVFSYFYLRSLDSNGLWHQPSQHPPILLSVVMLGLGVTSSLLFVWATRRLRAGRRGVLDWGVASAITTGVLALTVGLSIWQLSRLPFAPGDSGYASVFVGTEVVTIGMLLIELYQIETVLARSIRLRGVLSPGGDAADSSEVMAFRLAVDAASLFAGFMAIVLVGVFVLFYWVS